LNRKLLFLLTALSILLVSCSSGLYNRGQNALDNGDFKGAIESFEQALDENPEKSQLWRGLGIAYYNEKRYAEAVNALKQSSLLDPEDGLTVLYLGLSFERMNELADAANLYKSYLAKKPDEKVASKIRHRVRYLTDELIQNQINSLIADEKSINTESIPDNSLAVIGFNPGNLTPRYAPLARGLSELLVIDLSKIGDLRVVERLMLNAILDELEMTKSEYFDQTRVPRVGKLLGAAKVVSGQLTQTKENDLKLESGIIGVKEGFVDYPDDVVGQLDQFFSLEKELATNLYSALGYKMTSEEEAEFMELPTQSLLAFLSYSLGLEYIDQRMYSLAEAQFDNALREDPGFNLAANAKAEVRGLSNFTGDVESIEKLEKDITLSISSGEGARETGKGLRELQDALGFQPDTGEDEGDNPYTYPVVGTGSVTVIGTFDE
jgi:tetratricopeptide (TPR) repeat protein